MQLIVRPTLALLLAAGPALAVPIGSAFTYQGRLTDGGNPANGTFDLRFVLYTAKVGGSQVGPILTADEVEVAEGEYSLKLDFGAAAFQGEARWLEVVARPTGSPDDYAVVGRDELTPATQAIFASSAASVPWTGVSGKPAGFADNVDNDSGGTVTAVGTGAGLTGGPITGSGSVAVATGGIVSSMIANGAVGASQIDQAQVQTRIGGTCPLGSYLRGINPDGTVVCATLANPNSLATVAGYGDDRVGQYLSIAIPPDGLPVIAHHAETSGGVLAVTKCETPTCSTGSVTSHPEPYGDNNTGWYTSIAIGSDGLPVISYENRIAGALKVLKCSDPSCTTGQVATVDDPLINQVGAHTSIVVKDGRPIISYYDKSAGALKVARCGSANCASNVTITTVDNVNDVGTNTSIAIGTDGLPVISYRDATAQALKVAKCHAVACNTGATITRVATEVNGGKSSLAIPADGRPVISYGGVVSQNSVLRVLKCGNAACTSGNAIQSLHTSFGTSQTDSSITIGADGLPVISHEGHALRTVKCGNAACSSGNVQSGLDGFHYSNVGDYNAIALGADGLPVVAYTDDAHRTLKVAKCGSPSCK